MGGWSWKRVKAFSDASRWLIEVANTQKRALTVKKRCKKSKTVENELKVKDKTRKQSRDFRNVLLCSKTVGRCRRHVDLCSRSWKRVCVSQNACTGCKGVLRPENGRWDSKTIGRGRRCAGECGGALVWLTVKENAWKREVKLKIGKN